MQVMLNRLRGQLDAEFLRMTKRFAWDKDLASLAYYAFQGGKALRPALVHVAYNAITQRNCRLLEKSPLSLAMALEMVHTYSLIHDDLPAMDNDDYRRGRPTLHRLRDEAMALLVGDALLTGAFEVVATSDLCDRARVGCLRELSSTAGASGMVAGQSRDMYVQVKSLDDVLLTHRLKTGALFGAAFSMAYLAAKPYGQDLVKVRAWGAELGVLFQMVDDILDVTGSVQELGKTPGKDSAQGKVTFVNFFGSLEQAREAIGIKKQQLTQEGKEWIGPQGLDDLLNFLVDRKH